MDVILVLLGMCLLAGVVSVWVGLKNSREGEIRKQNGHRTTSRLMLAFVLASCIASSAEAQEVVHAITGTLTEASTTKNNFSITSDDGSIAMFKASAAKKAPITFSKELEAQTVAASSFHTVGAHVLVFYYGIGTVRTAIAIRNLGMNPVIRVTGRVKNFDKHHHSITLEGSVSAPVDILLSGDTIIDTPNGVTEGLKYHPNKGEHVGAVIRSSEGAATAVFISATGPNASMS